MSPLFCTSCMHEHRAKFPENYPYPDKVCPHYPESCSCISFRRVPPKDTRKLICRRCGLDSKAQYIGAHQAECMSEWVEVK